MAPKKILYKKENKIFIQFYGDSVWLIWLGRVKYFFINRVEFNDGIVFIDGHS